MAISWHVFLIFLLRLIMNVNKWKLLQRRKCSLISLPFCTELFPHFETCQLFFLFAIWNLRKMTLKTCRSLILNHGCNFAVRCSHLIFFSFLFAFWNWNVFTPINVFLINNCKILWYIVILYRNAYFRY